MSRLQTTVALVGMPGAGKSTIGRQLARRLGTRFVDTDVVIEHEIGCPIRRYFEEHGEQRFREVETSVLTAVLDDAGVLATGGGIVLRASNRALLHARATCIYLHSTPDDLFRRLRHDTRRPLLQVADPRARMLELFAERDPLYRDVAHFVIETGRPSMSTLVNMIVMQLELAGVVTPLGES